MELKSGCFQNGNSSVVGQPKPSEWREKMEKDELLFMGGRSFGKNLETIKKLIEENTRLKTELNHSIETNSIIDLKLQFERCVSEIVPTDYKNGYLEAIEHILQLKESEDTSCN